MLQKIFNICVMISLVCFILQFYSFQKETKEKISNLLEQSKNSSNSAQNSKNVNKELARTIPDGASPLSDSIAAKLRKDDIVR